ncbi:fungal-specific transcription factor domain-containing protein [Aspergillus californicus]
MTSSAADAPGPLRVLAPFHPDHRGPSLPLPRRTKRSNACTACKARKSKCDGGQPCTKCITLGSECIFNRGLDRRRRYAQRQAEEQLSSVQQQLDEIVDTFNTGDAAQLGELIDRVGRRPLTQNESPERTFLSEEHSGPSATGDIHDVIASLQPAPGVRTRQASVYSDSSMSVGSLDEVDTLTEDPNRNLESRAAGYIGKGSEIAWMQKLETEATNLNHGSRQQTPGTEESVMAMCYHVDYLHLEDPLPGDPRLLPPKPWAGRLVNIFFESIAPSFPLINKPLFTSQFNYAFTGSAEPTRKWLAVLNLVFAISSKHYQLADPVAGKDANDRVFLARAISLSSSQDLVPPHADVHQVQIDFLLALYYLVSGQVNRSWQTNGRAARSAVSLGLNLRTISDKIDPVSKEIRTRIWWCISSLEHLLASMTGRSSFVDYRSISLYPPVPYDEGTFHLPEVDELLGDTILREERLQWTITASNSDLQARNRWFKGISPTKSLYFFHLVDLHIITHAAVTTIYSVTTAKGSGQSGIPHYQKKLQIWLATLEPPFAFTDTYNNLSICRDHRGQVSLALTYYSSKIILSRPCLTRPDMTEGEHSRPFRSRFGNDNARTCVESALALISVLPDSHPSTEWMIKQTPWWCILHFLMQALTVLLIQLSIGPVPIFTPEGDANPSISTREEQASQLILPACKKGLRWVHALAKNDPSAYRAFQISESFIRRIGRAKNLDLSGVPDAPDMQGEAASAFPSGEANPWAGASMSRGGEWSGPSTERPARDGASRRTSRTTGIKDANVPSWGPDYTLSEEGNGHQSHSFMLDPALFSSSDAGEEHQSRYFAIDPALFSIDM